MKKNKGDKKYLIFGLVAVVLSLVVGYALYGEILNVTGTAATTGAFDIEFYSTSIASSTLSGTPTTTISGDKNTLTIDVTNLQAPGATTTVSVVVKNTGNMPATLTSVDVTGGTSEITVDYPTWATGIDIAAGAEYSFDITVTWDTESSTSDSTTFTATLNYDQAV